jgi:hypothetical protein
MNSSILSHGFEALRPRMSEVLEKLSAALNTARTRTFSCRFIDSVHWLSRGR